MAEAAAAMAEQGPEPVMLQSGVGEEAAPEEPAAVGAVAATEGTAGAAARTDRFDSLPEETLIGVTAEEEAGAEANGAEELPSLKADEAEGSEDDEFSSCSDYGSHGKPGTALQRLVAKASTRLPDTFQTSNLLFYERFKTYQDYMLADCKVSEVKEFIGSYLEKVLEPNGWQAVWRTNVFDVLVEVVDVEYTALKAVVRLCEPFLCEAHGSSAFSLECLQELLALKENRLPLQELWVVFDESGEFDHTALAMEHVRFFYKHIWRSWDEEDDDDFDYFVRCVEPRLRLYYDIMEERVPSALVAEYNGLLSQCEEQYRKFLDLRNSIAGTDFDSEVENVSMVEGVKLYDKIEHLKQKLKIIENPLLRYVFCYQKPTRLQAKGVRPSGTTVTHIVSATMMSGLLQCLLRDKFSTEPFYEEEKEMQFHDDPLSAVNACFEGDRIIVCPGHYVVEGMLHIVDSIELEGYGLPDDVVIEKRGKGDAFVECTAADVKISTLKFVQHDAVEGILSVHQGRTTLENCVLQCETTGVAVRTSAEFLMKNSDLYGAKGAGVEIYPGSMCILTGNGIHHCKEGILIKDFLDEHYSPPKITMTNNIIHNNEGYGVVLVKPMDSSSAEEGTRERSEDQKKDATLNDAAANPGCRELPQLDSSELKPCGREDASGNVESNSKIIHELSAVSLKKSQLHKKRLSNLGITEADENLMAQEMFVSIVGNQFKRNGKGSFGTFLY